nr:MAG TPA: hypothetical protein [Caudoviricetes sp.]
MIILVINLNKRLDNSSLFCYNQIIELQLLR